MDSLELVVDQPDLEQRMEIGIPVGNGQSALKIRDDDISVARIVDTAGNRLRNDFA